jgi:integrase
MARALNKLNVKQVAALKVAGRHSDGGGLYLRITSNGAKSWVFMAAAGGKRTEIGLGAESSVSLATARRIAADMREAVATGQDPRSAIQKRTSVQPDVVTFGRFAEQYISSVEEGWKNPIHRQQWRSSLRDHAGSLSKLPITAIGTEQVLAVLQPIWLTKPETARRVRGRIERILAAAKAMCLRDRDAANPAAWRGHLDVLLPKQTKNGTRHHPALPYQHAPAFMAELRDRPALAARCLEFTILTAARSGEALGATWSEIDLAGATWTLPGHRMKAGVEHVVPLSPPAASLLRGLGPETAPSEQRIFQVNGAARSNMAMAMLLRRMGHSDITVHGFRSAFKDWALNETSYPDELSEEALAHTIGSKVRRAYRRSTALDRRRELMALWAVFLRGC